MFEVAPPGGQLGRVEERLETDAVAQPDRGHQRPGAPGVEQEPLGRPHGGVPQLGVAVAEKFAHRVGGRGLQGGLGVAGGGQQRRQQPGERRVDVRPRPPRQPEHPGQGQPTVRVRLVDDAVNQVLGVGVVVLRAGGKASLARVAGARLLRLRVGRGGSKATFEPTFGPARRALQHHGVTPVVQPVATARTGRAVGAVRRVARFVPPSARPAAPPRAGLGVGGVGVQPKRGVGQLGLSLADPPFEDGGSAAKPAGRLSGVWVDPQRRAAARAEPAVRAEQGVGEDGGHGRVGDVGRGRGRDVDSADRVAVGPGSGTAGVIALPTPPVGELADFSSPCRSA